MRARRILSCVLGVLALVTLGLAVVLWLDGRDIQRSLAESRTREVFRLEVDLARTGRHEAVFRGPQNADHGLEFYLRSPSGPADIGKLREEGDGL